jgi:disulfide bond formation protein DsbB
MMRAQTIAIAVGMAAVALLLGALGFQYLGHLPPCELCMWQRWPHVAAAVVGLGGPLLIRSRLVERGVAPAIAGLAALLVALSGAVGVYHAGIEWHWWPGPQSCTGSAFQYTGGRLDLNAPVVVMCDRAAWRLFGISMAGYNALISFAIAAVAALALARSGRKA